MLSGITSAFDVSATPCYIPSEGVINTLQGQNKNRALKHKEMKELITGGECINVKPRGLSAARLALEVKMGRTV